VGCRMADPFNSVTESHVINQRSVFVPLCGHFQVLGQKSCRLRPLPGKLII
jgi:hypothetical protein